MVVGEAESAILVSKFEYADDAALVDENAALASTRVTALATGSMMDAAMLISIKKSKAMHVHRPMRVDATTEADVATLGLSHKCDSCGWEFTKQRGLRVHMARWCDGGRTQRSRLGTLTDKAVKTAKRRVAEAALDKVYVGNEALDNILHFEYLGSYRVTGGRDGCLSSHGRHAGCVRLTEPPVERPPPVPCDEAEAIPRLRVLDAHAFVSGLDPHKNGDAHGQRI